jgi:hypothetical protein
VIVRGKRLGRGSFALTIRAPGMIVRGKRPDWGPISLTIMVGARPR